MGTIYGKCRGNLVYGVSDQLPGCDKLKVLVQDEGYVSEKEVMSVIEIQVANDDPDMTFLAADITFSHPLPISTMQVNEVESVLTGSNDREVRVTFKPQKFGEVTILKATYAPIWTETLCIYDAKCYTDPVEMTKVLSTENGTFAPQSQKLTSEAQVRYTCGPASAFENEDPTAKPLPTLEATCELSGQWSNASVSGTLPACKCT
eukprot:maker-scaffold133_size323035-snap-gene-0.22 protein:Tk02229 transcript:maker-scaffold133_size323035-snap-gene-0.22-mRNA-1 annotation:"acetylcholine receptor non-alpha chain-like"